MRWRRSTWRSAAVRLLRPSLLAGQVLRQGTVSLGNGFLYADQLSALVALLTAFVYLVCAPYAVGYLRRDEAETHLAPSERRSRHGRAAQAAHVLHADAAVRLLHVPGGGGQQPGRDVDGRREHHAGLDFSGDILRASNLAGSRLEVRHDRQRRTCRWRSSAPS